MPANWSLILNILLLIGVVIAIGRLMKARKESLNFDRYQPKAAKAENSPYDRQPLHDDIIAVRKVNAEETILSAQPQQEYKPEPKYNKAPVKKAMPQLIPQEESASVAAPALKTEVKQQKKPVASTVMMLLLAKENRNFAGYDLLQTVLASGLRFGEGNLFHRHQANGQGPILCSLAAATATGVFDLQNIGAFSVRGLCIFMNVSNDDVINAECFTMMLETGKQLSEGLNAYLLDDQKKPLNAERMARYYSMLNIDQEEHEFA